MDDADVVLYADTASLLAKRPIQKRSNPSPSEDYSAYFDAEIVDGKIPRLEDLYQGHSGLLVKTALIRSKDFEKASRNPPRIRSSRDVVKLCAHHANSDVEYVIALPVDTHHRVLAIHEAALGQVNGATVECRDVFKVAMLVGAYAVIVVHNHPSGDSTPSEEDIHLTSLMGKAAIVLGIPLVDHVIIAKNGSFSFLDGNLMPSRASVQASIDSFLRGK